MELNTPTLYSQGSWNLRLCLICGWHGAAHVISWLNGLVGSSSLECICFGKLSNQWVYCRFKYEIGLHWMYSFFSFSYNTGNKVGLIIHDHLSYVPPSGEWTLMCSSLHNLPDPQRFPVWIKRLVFQVQSGSCHNKIIGSQASLQRISFQGVLPVMRSF